MPQDAFCFWAPSAFINAIAAAEPCWGSLYRSPRSPTKKCDRRCSHTPCLQYFSLQALCWQVLKIIIIITNLN